MTLWLCDLRQGSILSESPSPHPRMGIVLRPLLRVFTRLRCSDISAVLGTAFNLQKVLGGYLPQVYYCPDFLPDSESLLLSHYSRCGPRVMVSSHQTDSSSPLRPCSSASSPVKTAWFDCTLGSGFFSSEEEKAPLRIVLEAWRKLRLLFLSPEEAAMSHGRACKPVKVFFVSPPSPGGRTLALQQGPLCLVLSSPSSAERVCIISVNPPI